MRGERSPWRKAMILQNCWRCTCNRVVSNKLKKCDKCGRSMKAITMTDQAERHQQEQAALTQRIGELCKQVNDRDREIERLKKELELTHRKAAHGCYDFHCSECD